MSTRVNGYSAPIGIGIGPALTTGAGDSSTGSTAARTRQAAAAIGQYMQQSGTDTMTPNQLSQLARNAPDDVSAAASFLLRNPDIYALLETHDVAGRDGISGASNFDFAARGGYDAQLQDAAPSAAKAATPAVTEQDARNAIAAFRQQNPSARIDPNTLYQLAMRPDSDTAPATSAAAKFLLKNPDVLDKITAPAPEATAPATTPTTTAAPAASPAASAPKGPEQSATQQTPGSAAASPARTGGAPASGSQALDGQSAARILAGHMLSGTTDASGAPGASGAAGTSGTSAGTAASSAPSAMTVDQLYRLAEGGKAPPEVAAAAKFMLKNPDICRTIETHDVPGADGKSAVGNLLAAARGEIPGVGGKSSQTTNSILKLLQLLLQVLNGTPASSSGANHPAAKPLDTQGGSRTLAPAGNAVPATGSGTQDRLGQLLQQLQLLLQLLKSLSQPAGAAPSPASKQPLDAQGAARILADYMISEAGGARQLVGNAAPPATAPMTPDRLYQLSQGQGPVADAARFMLQHPDIYRAIETHDVAGADGISGLGNLLAAARGEVPGVNGRTGQQQQQLQQLLQVLSSLLSLVQATATRQSPSAARGTTADQATDNDSPVQDVLRQILKVLKSAQPAQAPAQAMDGQHAASILANYLQQTRLRQSLAQDPMSSVRELLGQAAESMQVFAQQQRMLQIGLQMRILQLSTTVV